MKKTHLLPLIASLMVLMTPLTACSGAPTPDGAATPAPSSQVASGDLPDAPAEGEERALVDNVYQTGLPIVKDKETYRIVWIWSPSSTLPAAEKQAAIAGEADTNVAIRWEQIDSAAWNEKVGLMIASQELPDAFLGPIAPFMSANKDAFVDVAPMVDAYAPTLAAMFAQYPLLQPQLMLGDNSMRRLPTSQMRKVDESTSTMYWINENWLKAVGKTAPTNTDELKDLLIAFRDGDPNGNGKKDEIPLSFCNNYWAGKFGNLFGPFGVLGTDNHIRVDDGKVVFQPTQQGFYDALVYYNGLYQEGLLDAEGFSQTADQHQAKIRSDVLGIMSTYNPPAGLGYVAMPLVAGPDGTKLYDGMNEVSAIANFSITQACKKPEVLLRYYEYVNSDMKRKLSWNYGPEGELWTIGETGPWTQLDDNVPEGKSWDEQRSLVGFSTNCFAYFTPDECARIVDRNDKMRYDAVTNEYMAHFPDPYLAIGDAPEVASEKNLLKTEIDAYIANFIAISVLEGIDEVKWQQHLKSCESLNVARYVELMQIPYDAFQQMLK